MGVVSCALATVNSTLLQGNRAQSAGAVYLYNSLPVSGTYKPEDPVGAMIAVVAKSNFTDNVAVPAPDAVMLTVRGACCSARFAGRESSLAARRYCGIPAAIATHRQCLRYADHRSHACNWNLQEGFGGGIYLRSHVSTLLADSYFKGNNASLQGGSIFIESTCDLVRATRNVSVPDLCRAPESKAHLTQA